MDIPAPRNPNARVQLSFWSFNTSSIRWPALPAVFLVSLAALDLFYTGRIIDGAEAFKLGIVNRLAESGNLMDTAMDLGRSIAANAPIPIKQVRKAVYGNRYKTLEEALDYEATAQAVCYNTEDFKHGLQAVQNKATPHFKGK